MATELVHVGFGNYLASNRIAHRLPPNSAPAQRLIRKAKEERIVIDMTSGRRTKTAVVLDSGQVVLLAITPEALAGRVTAARQDKVAQAQAAVE